MKNIINGNNNSKIVQKNELKTNNVQVSKTYKIWISITIFTTMISCVIYYIFLI